MCTRISSFSVSSFRSHTLVWSVLAAMWLSLLPSASFAQVPPSATIDSLTGEVQVSGQPATTGMILYAGDTLRLEAGGSLVLSFSDGSTVHVGENSRIKLMELRRTPDGVRISIVKLLNGQVRGFIAPEHQQEGSMFRVQTPNAQLDVKFSQAQPDIEISYDQETHETIGIAHTVQLAALNILTDESTIVPVGATVIITDSTVKVMAAIAGAEETSRQGRADDERVEETMGDSPREKTPLQTPETEAATEPSGEQVTMETTETDNGSKNKKILLIGAGGALALGGILALAAGGSSGSDSTAPAATSPTNTSPQISDVDANPQFVNPGETVDLQITYTDTSGDLDGGMTFVSDSQGNSYQGVLSNAAKTSQGGLINAAETSGVLTTSITLSASLDPGPLRLTVFVQDLAGNQSNSQTTTITVKGEEEGYVPPSGGEEGYVPPW